jgi:hypothetical protein
MVQEDQRELLLTALEKARKLLDGIRQQQAELEANPPRHLPPDQFAQGKETLNNAALAARRTVRALESALELSDDLPDGRNGA